MSAKDCRCAIEVVNTSGNNGEPVRVGAIAVSSDPVPDYAEHGRGLKIIDAVADNLQLTGNDSQGTIVHFEKTLEWLPGAAGEHLISTDSGADDRTCRITRTAGRNARSRFRAGGFPHR